MKLQSKIISVILIVFVISLFFFGLIVFNSSKSILLTHITNQLQSISDITSNNINNFMYGQENKLELIATQNSLSNEELIEMIKIDNSFYELFVMDSTGIIIASSSVDNIGINKSSESYFYEARNNTYTHEGFYSELSKQYSFTVSTPFNGGVLVGRTNLNYLNKITTIRTGLGNSGEILLAYKDSHDNLVYFSERRFSNQAVEVITPEQAEGRPIYYAINKEKGVYIGNADYRGVNVIAVTSYVDKLNLGMVVKIDISEAFVQIYELQKLTILIMVITIILIFIIIFVITKPISDEIVSITNSIDRITKGELDIQLKKSYTFEIQSLIDSLNRILASMKLAILRTNIQKEDLGIGEVIKDKKESLDQKNMLIDKLK